MIEYFVAALTRSAASGSRSTALAPLHWMLVLVFIAFLGSFWTGTPGWVTVLFGVVSVGVVLLGGGAYVYLLLNDRDALRSERFTIEKMKIEKGILGDTASGFREVVEGAKAPTLPPAASDGDVV